MNNIDAKLVHVPLGICVTEPRVYLNTIMKLYRNLIFFFACLTLREFLKLAKGSLFRSIFD